MYKLIQGIIMNANIVIFLLLTINLAVYGQVDNNFYISDIADEYLGVYLPIEYINSINLSRNHSTSMNLNRENKYRDILIVHKNIIYSNLKYHDGYAIPANEINYYSFYENDRGEQIISDNHNYLYKKISSNIDNYSKTVENFIGKIILVDLCNIIDGIEFNDDFIILPFLQYQNYKIELDEVFIEKGANLILVNRSNDEWIYLVIDNDEYIFYQMYEKGIGILKSDKIIYRIKI
jgi:hypothetical protein